MDLSISMITITSVPRLRGICGKKCEMRLQFLPLSCKILDDLLNSAGNKGRIYVDAIEKPQYKKHLPQQTTLQGSFLRFTLFFVWTPNASSIIPCSVMKQCREVT